MTLTMTKSLVVSLSMVAVAACGGGDGGGGGNTMANTQSASQAVTSTSTLQSSIGSMNGQGAGAALNAIGSSAQGIVTPSYEGQPSALIQVQEALQQINTFGTVEAAAFAPGDCLCDAAGNCTFDQCGMGSGYELTGTITKSGDVYAVDVTVDLNTTGIMYAWRYSGSVTMTATLIDGQLEGDGTGTVMGGGQTVSYSHDWTVDYNMIGLDAQGCATSGSMEASVDFSVSGASAGNYSGSATITFGPACGTATAS